jgi:hypothetical protein
MCFPKNTHFHKKEQVLVVSNINKIKAGGVIQPIEHLPSKCEALSSKSVRPYLKNN